jgi:hypothetical protein
LFGITRDRRSSMDIIFVESPESEGEFKEVAASVPAPTLANMVETGRYTVPLRTAPGRARIRRRDLSGDGVPCGDLCRERGHGAVAQPRPAGGHVAHRDYHKSGIRGLIPYELGGSGDLATPHAGVR